MSNLREVVNRFQNVRERVNRVVDIFPTLQGTTKDYEGSILQAGGESLSLIDRLTSGERVNLRSITSSENTLEAYIEKVTRQSNDGESMTGNYVVVEVHKQRFLGIARLVKRELSIPELRRIYNVGKAYDDGTIIAAKQSGQLEMTQDVGVQVSFSLMPLAAISEVHQIGTKNAKLAAHATATNILTSAESSQMLQTEFGDSHHQDPGFLLTDIHYITPMAMALSATTEPGNLDRILLATTMTTNALHGDRAPTLATTFHMHDLPERIARDQTKAVGETGLLGGVSTSELVFWLQGWSDSIHGINQSDLRRNFGVLEVDQESSLATSQGLDELTPDQKLELTIITGVALTAPSARLLEKQVSRISDKRNLLLPVRQVFRP